MPVDPVDVTSIVPRGRAELKYPFTDISNVQVLACTGLTTRKSVAATANKKRFTAATEANEGLKMILRWAHADAITSTDCHALDFEQVPHS